MNPILLLSHQKKKAYLSIENALKSGKLQISVPLLLPMQELAEVYKLVIGNNPDLLYADPVELKAFIVGVTKILECKAVIQLSNYKHFKYTLEKEVSRVYEKYIKHKETEVQKILAIHDYLINSVVYNNREPIALKYNYFAHNAYGALVNKKAVCDGIACAFQALANKAGINSSIIFGDAGGEKHAWNIVEIDGDNYHIDVTWDLKNTEIDGFNRYDYFCVTDENMSNRTWNKSLYSPCKNLRYNYFKLMDSIAYSEMDLKRIIKKQLSKHKKAYLKFEGKYEGDFQSYVLNVSREICEKNNLDYYQVNVFYNEDQKTVIIITE